MPAYRNAVLPLPTLDEAATGNGSVTLGGDADGIIRKAPLLARQGDQLLPSLSLNLIVRDTERSVAFYRDVLGAEIHYRDIDFAAVRFGPAEVMLHADHTHDTHPWTPTLASDAPVQSDLRDTLTEVSRAARTLQDLADYLSRHPESLIRGKKGD